MIYDSMKQSFIFNDTNCHLVSQIRNLRHKNLLSCQSQSLKPGKTTFFQPEQMYTDPNFPYFKDFFLPHSYGILNYSSKDVF